MLTESIGTSVAKAEVINTIVDGVTIRVSHTDESQMNARSVCRVLDLPINDNICAHSKLVKC